MVTDPRPTPPPEDADENLRELWEVYETISAKNLQEPFHDATEIKEESLARFNLGLMTINERADIEKMYWAICHKLTLTSSEAEYVPEDLEPVERALADTYFGNFSVFQSAPDSWAIGQLFPVMPIHRLGERPTRRGVLADITCDSDGKIEKFIDRRDVKHVLELHEPNGQPSYVGMFLLGAYQEILGDLHNLFGDTNAVHVSTDDRGEVVVDAVIKGDTVREVLDYVEFDPNQLVQRLRASIEQAVRDGRICDGQAGRFLKFYEEGLGGYTYLEEPG
jgi:arginine decarboxylase